MFFLRKNKTWKSFRDDKSTSQSHTNRVYLSIPWSISLEFTVDCATRINLQLIWTYFLILQHIISLNHPAFLPFSRYIERIHLKHLSWELKRLMFWTLWVPWSSFSLKRPMVFFRSQCPGFLISLKDRPVHPSVFVIVKPAHSDSLPILLMHQQGYLSFLYEYPFLFSIYWSRISGLLNRSSTIVRKLKSVLSFQRPKIAEHWKSQIHNSSPSIRCKHPS